MRRQPGCVRAQPGPGGSRPRLYPSPLPQGLQLFRCVVSLFMGIWGCAYGVMVGQLRGGVGAGHSKSAPPPAALLVPHFTLLASHHPHQPSRGPQPRFSLEIEMRTVNISEDELGINPARLVERVDANTIGVVAILGTTYTGKGRVKGRGSKGRAGGPGVCTCTPAPPRNRQTTFFHKCIRCVRGCGWTGCRARGVPRPHRPRCWHPRRRCIGRVCRPLPLARHEGGFPPPARCVDESEWP